MKIVQILILYCWLPVALKAQQCNVTGFIQCNGIPVSGILIQLQGESVHTTHSMPDGKFEFKAIPCKLYSLNVDDPNYFQFQSNIQADTISKPLQVILTERSSELNEVVITGSMKEIGISESAVKIDLISPKLFQKNPTPNLFQAVGMVNGVKPQLNCNVCNTGDIHINGMEGPYTMILIDGMPIVSGLSTVYGLMGIPNSIVERIEIMKGPAGALYGSEAMGGIINVITKNPSTTPHFFVDHQSTTYKELNTDLAWRIKIGKNANTLFSANYFHFDNVVDKNNDGFTDITLQKRFSVFNKWNIRYHNKPLLHFAARYVYEDRWGGQTNYTNQWRGTDSIYGESIYTNRIEFISSLQIPVKEKIILQSSYNYHNQNSYYGTTPYMAAQQILFNQLYWDKEINDAHSFLFGYSGRYVYYDDNTPVTAMVNDDLVSINKPDQRYIHGLFYQHEYKPGSKHTFLAGMRSDYDETHKFIFSPRFAYKFSPNSNNQFRLNTGTGFRVVNLFTEDHMALTGARKVIIKENLNPEQSQNINLNYTRTFNSSKHFLSLDAGAFLTIFSNRILADYDTDPQLVIYENLKGNAITKGLSLTIEYTNSSALKIISGITFSDATYDKQNNNGELEKTRQLFAPLFSGNYLISYTLKKQFISFDLTGNWYGPQRLPIQPNDFRPEYSPWFSIVNIQLKKSWRSFEFYTGVKNIFNFIPQHPIMRANDPFNKTINDPVNNPQGYTFDPSYNYASLQGITGYIGFRLTIR